VAVGATLGTGDQPSDQSDTLAETPAEPQADGAPQTDAPSAEPEAADTVTLKSA
jgi:hypothetical protein